LIPTDLKLRWVTAGRNQNQLFFEAVRRVFDDFHHVVIAVKPEKAFVGAHILDNVKRIGPTHAHGASKNQLARQATTQE
jgi:hypothetical protein